MCKRKLYEQKKDRIKVINQKPVNTKDELISIAGTDKVCACDFYVDGSERWLADGHILMEGRFLNIDHHSSLEELKSRISSGNIAASFVKKYGILDDDYIVVLNHLDCDSVVSSFIMLGILEPEPRLIRSVISADHTGDKDDIADLLQALEDTKNLDLIAKNLFDVMDGDEPEEEAKRLLRIREKNRERIASMVEMKRFHKEGDVSYMVTESNLDPALLVSLLPESVAIMVSSVSKEPEPRDEQRWDHRIRLGMKMEGISMKDLDLPDFGGRWNAGSTRRNGGTKIPPKRYAYILDRKLKERLDNRMSV